MVQINGRRPLACHHEAGHALARWYFGFGIDRVVVLTIEEVRARTVVTNRKGYEVQCEGICEGNDIHTQPYGRDGYGRAEENSAEHIRWRTLTRDVELINCLAGPYAEAAYRNIPVTNCLRLGGEDDLETVNAILDAWGHAAGSPERKSIRQFAGTSAKALVRSPMGAAAIRSIAELLFERGEVEEEDIDALCRAAYGGKKCRFGAWSDRHWPPSLAEIRSGYIPDKSDPSQIAA